MKRLSIRWLLLGVAGASLLLPLLSFLVLRLLDPYLVQQTEKQLNAEAVLIAEAYRSLWSEALQVPLGDPRPPGHQGQTFVVPDTRIRDLSELAAALPEQLPARQAPPAHQLDTRALDRSLSSAQIFNLSGVRVLDEAGCAVASSRAQLGLCFGALPEVRAALRGQHTAAIRARNSDEPTPPVGGLRRRGDLRVFVAHPIYDDGRLLGVVWLSRTAESGLEFLVKQRRGLFYGGLLVIVSVLVVSAAFARLIIRPLRQMAQASAALARGEHTQPLAQIQAPLEIHVLGSAFDSLTERLQERALYVSNFAAQVSHELKTPLTSIRGALELLLEPGSAMDEPQRLRFLENMAAATTRTERLVERLLLLARLENPSEAAPPQLLGLDEWLAANASNLGKAVEFHATPEAEHTERPALELDSVLGNLIDNALRYRRELPVRVHMDLEGEFLHVQVSDDGPGISAENQTRLFERFFTTERDRGGTGLGLAIVKAIAEARGGRVALASGPNGTTAEVWF